MRQFGLNGKLKRGVVLVGVLFTIMALSIGIYASVASMKVASRNISNKEMVLHAQMGAESAIEAGLGVLNRSTTLDSFGASATGDDCDITNAAQNYNNPPLSYGQYIVGPISPSSIAPVYKVNFAVNLDLSASLLLSSSAWISYSRLLPNKGYPEASNVTNNSYQGSTSTQLYLPKCTNASYLRLLRAEANVVKVGLETQVPSVRRRIAAVVSIDPHCTDLPYSGFAGCKGEVIQWYEE